MSQRPGPPQGVKSPGINDWLFLFWKYIVDFALDNLADVTITSAASGDYLRYNGTVWVNVTVSQILTDLLTVDGSGSGLDADLLDGQSGAYYLDSANFTGTNWTDLTDGGDTTLHIHDSRYYTESEVDAIAAAVVAMIITDHGGLTGLSDNDHPQYLLVADIDDTPVNGVVDAPISSNWAYDHVAAADPHTGYRLESADHNHQSTGAQAGQLDHGLALTGLTDDDHTQYVLNNGTRTGVILAAGSADFLQIGAGANASEIRFMEPSAGGTNYTGFKAPALAGNVIYTLPTADGSSSQVLQTNGSGVLSWATAGSGSDATPMTPQGRLTLATGTPVMATEQAAQTTIYYTPYVGDIIPIYNGSSWTNTTFTELSLAMAGSANWAADTNYDLYVVNDSGTLRLGTGAAWTNGTTRAESLTRVNGILTNNASMTLRYGASSTLTAAANTATYVGTFRTTASTGTTTWELGGAAAGGDPIFLYLWNCYNRAQVTALNRDTTDNSAAAASTTPAAYLGSNSNRASFVRGLAEEGVQALFCGAGVNSTPTNVYCPLGLDSTSAVASGSTSVGAGGSILAAMMGAYTGDPGIGLHYLQALQVTQVASGTSTFFGDAGLAMLQTGLHFTGMF